MKIVNKVIKLLKNIPLHIEISKRTQLIQRSFFSISGVLVLVSLFLSLEAIFCESYLLSVSFLVSFLVISLTALACFVEFENKKESH